MNKALQRQIIPSLLIPEKFEVLFLCMHRNNNKISPNIPTYCTFKFTNKALYFANYLQVAQLYIQKTPYRKNK